MNTLGASELPVVVGCPRVREDGEPYVSPGSVWARLVGLIERYDDDPSPDAELGHWYEPSVGLRFCAENGLTMGVGVYGGPALDKRPLCDDESLPWLHARPDLLLRWRGPVELKCPRDLDPERWGDEPPADHLVQLIAQVAVCRRVGLGDVGMLAAMARAPRRSQRTWVQYTWPLDEDLEQEVLDAGWRWYTTHVTGMRAPEADGTADYSRTLARLWTSEREVVVDANADVREDVRRLLQVRTAERERQRHIRTLRQRIQLAMGEGNVLRIDGQVAVTWKTDKNGRRRFLVKMPDGTLEEDDDVE